MTGPLRLGTRRSLMATTQSGLVAARLTELTGRAVELVGVTTYGDVTKGDLAQMGGTGVFVSALRDKLIDGEVDFAVHSLKDLPTTPDPRIALAAIPPRDDHRDALVAGAKLADLPPGSKVGTGSPRRIAQLRALRPDLEYVSIRGNADTRIGKVASGELQGVVLAAAGLRRLGREAEIAQIFEVDEMLPAPGQGALAVEARADRADLVELLGVLDDAATRAAVTAERAVLNALEAGCAAPVGAHSVVTGQDLNLTAAVIAIDGGRAVRKSTAGSSSTAMDLGRALATEMIAEGAGTLMGEQQQ
ncbi:hydroxymethylbilane synthase [Planomonospora sp. ID91781]|uniref:Porphobilinogen deaminase n=3 Tax=Planomonospora TaxID=1998 RepID=A0A171DD58_9ACTN|nr:MULTISPECIES: hydroxymethylbilane synthase [Planomonospora]MBG0820314.1 hydroxymethylbilane synthase [Planomonospora sp. ID91781]GAT68030.1 porphobilinogen deaminase [Planomonospora sphaerica]GGK79827.1 porphobilinogen deaminase 1 [Planomonospora parontospora]GII11258.1 porphobilinogen deaminase 1 [Planomonospora parontospora subsp. parontospora]